MNIDVSIFRGVKILFFLPWIDYRPVFFCVLFWDLGTSMPKNYWSFAAVLRPFLSDFRGFPNRAGTAHIQLLKSWKNYYYTVYKAEEKLDKNNIKTLFLGDDDYSKILPFVPMHPWFCFTRETSILVSVSSSASLVADPGILKGKRFVVNWSLVWGSLIRLSSRVLHDASISLHTIKPLNPIWPPLVVWPKAWIKFTLPNTRFFLIKLRRKEVLFLSSPPRKSLTVNIFWSAVKSPTDYRCGGSCQRDGLGVRTRQLGGPKNLFVELDEEEKPFLIVLNPFPVKVWTTSLSLRVFPSGRPRLYCWNWRWKDV